MEIFVQNSQIAKKQRRGILRILRQTRLSERTLAKFSEELDAVLGSHPARLFVFADSGDLFQQAPELHHAGVSPRMIQACARKIKRHKICVLAIP